MSVRRFNSRRPLFMSLITKDYMTVVCNRGAGKFLGVHLRALESDFDIVIERRSVNGAVLRYGGHTTDRGGVKARGDREIGEDSRLNGGKCSRVCWHLRFRSNNSKAFGCYR
ncbi:hypothetical protein HanRHA438_Chr17g0809601 [Helianthus annuus]|nr:hypothetical protein HanRHA438_Chr17g0809601 [Helianthus annuus]